MTNKSIAPKSFIELLKDIYVCVNGRYYPKYNSIHYRSNNCSFEEIKYGIDFTGKFNDFLKYYETEIAGKEIFITAVLDFDIFYNYNGYGKRIRSNSLIVERYFNDNIGFG